ALSAPITRFARRHATVEGGRDHGVPSRPRWGRVLLYQFLVSVYGGYFGAGIGIMMLAGLALVGFTAIHRMIALRKVHAIRINGRAVVDFILGGTVDWPDAAVLPVGQVTGSGLGAQVARRMPASAVRTFVIAVGCAMAASFFLRRP